LRPPALVVLGNLLVDDLVFEDGRTRMGEAGGAVLYAALGARLSGASVGLVSLRGDDYPAATLAALAARGVDLTGVAGLGRPGLRAWLLYEGGRRRIVQRLETPTHAEASPGFEAIPTAWRAARGFHVAPMPLSVQAPLVAALAARPGAFVSLDPHLPLQQETLAEWAPVLAGLDALFVGEDEQQLGDDLSAAALRLATIGGGRLSRIVFKRGARGGTLIDLASGERHEWAPRAQAVVDPTGAGDAFAAGVLAGWLQGEGHAPALARGVLAASFALEGWGAAGLLAADSERAESRRHAWWPPEGAA
jgi:sugar/nucleoside kinase (ribokinase family)